MKVRKKPHSYSFVLLYWSWKPAFSLQSVAEFPISVQLGIWAMMHISPLSLWNKPNIMFESNSSADKTFFFPYCLFICHQTQDPGYCFWMTALTLSWKHLLCSWVSTAAHCPLSKLLLKTGPAEKVFCQKFIARLQLRFHFLQWTLLSFLQLALDCATKSKFHPSKPKLFTFLKIKPHHLWRLCSQCTQ